MRLTNCVKVAALSAAALWLAGCTSTGGDSTSSAAAESTQPIVAEEVVVETIRVLDPAVQAVVDSGAVQADPEQIEAMLYQTDYSFPFDSSSLARSDFNALDTHAAYLNSNEGQDKHLMVQGHTDERGTRTYNLALGERRANAVKNYLVAKGVAASRIEVISFGFEKPLDSQHNETAWAKNRRAHIVVN